MASAVAIGTLGLALAAGLVVFSVFSGLLLHPLPYPGADGLVWLATSTQRNPAETGVQGRSADLNAGTFSAPDYLDLRRQAGLFEAVAAYFPNVATLAGGSPPQHIAYTNVSGNFFQVLGAAPALGRSLNIGDETPPLAQAAVLSDGLWRQRYGADPNIVGRGINLDNRYLTVVGVMPPGFDYPEGSELWAPEPFSSPVLQQRNARFLSVIGRLRRPGDLAAAQQQLRTVANRLAASYPDSDSGLNINAMRLSERLRAAYSGSLWLLMLSGLLLYGVACANVANLLLADAVGRRREMAIRASLGATRARLTGQFMTEAMVMAGAATGVGWLLAVLALPVVRRLHPASLPELAGIGLDPRVQAFALGLTVLTAAWLGAVPAWEALKQRPGRSLQAALREDAQHTATQAWVAGAEVAAAVVLLVVAGLLLRSTQRLQQVDPGYNPDQVLSYRASLLYNSMEELRAGASYFERLNRRVQDQPGVVAAGMISSLPLSAPQARLGFFVAGSSAGAALREVERPQAGLARVLPGYFAAMAIPLQGRDFNDGDDSAGARVIIVSRKLAHDLFPHANALGRSLEWGTAGAMVTAQIVGIAGDVRQVALAQAPGWQIYEPYPQSPTGDMSGVVRARGNPWQLQPVLRRAAAAVNPEIPLYRWGLLQQNLDAALAPDRFRAGLLLTIAALALVLALAGVYSVLAQGVAQRQREIGVRMALGASPGQVRRLVLKRGLGVCLGGVLAGVAAAVLVTRGLEHWLYGVTPADPLTFAAVTMGLLAVGLAASYLPARQATRVNPVIALRCE